MTADGCLRADDDNVFGPAPASSTLRARFHDSDHRNACGSSNLGQRKCRGGVAGDHQQLSALLLKETGGRNSVFSYRLRGLGTVGQASGIAKVDVIGSGHRFNQSFNDRQAAEAGIENPQCGPSHGRRPRNWFECTLK